MIILLKYYNQSDYYKKMNNLLFQVMSFSLDREPDIKLHHFYAPSYSALIQFLRKSKDYSHFISDSDLKNLDEKW